MVNALIDKGLLKEVKANRKLNDPVWRETDEGRVVTLVITDAGLAAIGIEVRVTGEACKPKPTRACHSEGAQAPRRHQAVSS